MGFLLALSVTLELSAICVGARNVHRVQRENMPTRREIINVSNVKLGITLIKKVKPIVQSVPEVPSPEGQVLKVVTSVPPDNSVTTRRRLLAVGNARLGPTILNLVKLRRRRVCSVLQDSTRTQSVKRIVTHVLRGVTATKRGSENVTTVLLDTSRMRQDKRYVRNARLVSTLIQKDLKLVRHVTRVTLLTLPEPLSANHVRLESIRRTLVQALVMPVKSGNIKTRRVKPGVTNAIKELTRTKQDKLVVWTVPQGQLNLMPDKLNALTVALDSLVINLGSCTVETVKQVPSLTEPKTQDVPTVLPELLTTILQPARVLCVNQVPTLVIPGPKFVIYATLASTQLRVELSTVVPVKLATSRILQAVHPVTAALRDTMLTPSTLLHARLVSQGTLPSTPLLILVMPVMLEPSATTKLLTV